MQEQKPIDSDAVYEFLSDYDLEEESSIGLSYRIETEFDAGAHQALDPRLFDGGNNLYYFIEEAKARLGGY